MFTVYNYTKREGLVIDSWAIARAVFNDILTQGHEGEIVHNNCNLFTGRRVLAKS